MQKPKNCPKCNQPPVLMQTYGVCGFTRIHYVECKTCGIRTYAHMTQIEAAESWNAEKDIITTGGVFK